MVVTMVRSLLMQDKILESKEFYNQNPEKFLHSLETPKQLQVWHL